jgi:type I restriction enzyme R subunit
MPTPGEHKTVQARILKYAEEIGWTFVLCAEARLNRGRPAVAGQPAVKQWWTGMSVYC